MLEAVAIEYSCAVILTNTMTPDISVNFGDFETRIKPALGYSHLHRIHQRVVLTRDGSGNVLAGIQKSPTQGPAVVALKVTMHGVTDA